MPKRKQQKQKQKQIQNQKVSIHIGNKGKNSSTRSTRSTRSPAKKQPIIIHVHGSSGGSSQALPGQSHIIYQPPIPTLQTITNGNSNRERDVLKEMEDLETIRILQEEASALRHMYHESRRRKKLEDSEFIGALNASQAMNDADAAAYGQLVNDSFFDVLSGIQHEEQVPIEDVSDNDSATAVKNIFPFHSTLLNESSSIQSGINAGSAIPNALDLIQGYGNEDSDDEFYDSFENQSPTFKTPVLSPIVGGGASPSSRINTPVLIEGSPAYAVNVAARAHPINYEKMKLKDMADAIEHIDPNFKRYQLTGNSRAHFIVKYGERLDQYYTSLPQVSSAGNLKKKGKK